MCKWKLECTGGLEGVLVGGVSWWVSGLVGGDRGKGPQTYHLFGDTKP